MLYVLATPGVYIQTNGSYQGGPNGFSGGDQTFTSAGGWTFQGYVNDANDVNFRLYQGDPNQSQHLDFTAAGQMHSLTLPGQPVRRD